LFIMKFHLIFFFFFFLVDSSQIHFASHALHLRHCKGLCTNPPRFPDLPQSYFLHGTHCWLVLEHLIGSKSYTFSVYQSEINAERTRYFPRHFWLFSVLSCSLARNEKVKRSILVDLQRVRVNWDSCRIQGTPE
jgi:hypothetical protein